MTGSAGFLTFIHCGKAIAPFSSEDASGLTFFTALHPRGEFSQARIEGARRLPKTQHGQRLPGCASRRGRLVLTLSLSSNSMRSRRLFAGIWKTTGTFSSAECLRRQAISKFVG